MAAESRAGDALGETHRPIVVGLGEVLWDLLPSGRQLGGAPANCAFHADRLGAQGIIVSSVGADELGRELLERLGTLGLDTRYVSVGPEHPTGTVSVELDPKGGPQYVIHAPVAWDFIPFTPELAGLAERADAVCVGCLAQRSATSRQTIQRFLATTLPACLRVFDLNLRQHYYDREVIEQTLKRCQVLKLNEAEWPLLARLLDAPPGVPEGVEQLRRQWGLRLIARTSGEKGSELYSAEGVLRRAAPALRVVDTVGAGDAFTAALVIGLLRNESLEHVHESATQLAAYVCTQSGATPEHPTDATAHP